MGRSKQTTIGLIKTERVRNERLYPVIQKLIEDVKREHFLTDEMIATHFNKVAYPFIKCLKKQWEVSALPQPNKSKPPEFRKRRNMAQVKRVSPINKCTTILTEIRYF